jgi:hypothetical protein
MCLSHEHGPRTRAWGVLRRACKWSFLGLATLGLLLATAPTVEASPRKARPAKSKGAAKPAARAADGPALSDAKIAVLAFEGDDAEPLRKHVIKVFVERGLKVNSTLKAQDNPTQYRDMGAALDLAVYVHGKIKDTTPDHAVATVTIRSAVTGRPVATATFNGFRRGLPFDVEEKLWERVAPAFKRACAEATKPGRRHNEPTRIEAGTPL